MRKQTLVGSFLRRTLALSSLNDENVEANLDFVSLILCYSIQDDSAGKHVSRMLGLVTAAVERPLKRSSIRCSPHDSADRPIREEVRSEVGSTTPLCFTMATCIDYIRFVSMSHLSFSNRIDSRATSSRESMAAAEGPSG